MNQPGQTLQRLMMLDRLNYFEENTVTVENPIVSYQFVQSLL